MKKRKAKSLLACLVATSLLASTTSVFAAATESQGPVTSQNQSETEQRADFVKGEALILYRPGISARNNSLQGFTIKQEWDFSSNRPYVAGTEAEKVALVSKDNLSTEELISQLELMDGVIYAEPNYIYHINGMTSDTYIDSQWGLKSEEDGEPGIDVQAGWNAAENGEENVVAVLDSGVDYTNPDLKNVMWVNPGNANVQGKHGYDFFQKDPDPMPTSIEEGGEYGDSHGTHCAGIIAAEIGNAQGIAGVSPNTKIMALRIGDAQGMPTDAILGAYEYMITAKQNGVNIVAANNSWGGAGGSSKIFDYALNKTGELGILSVCAAGNEQTDIDEVMDFPASIDSPYILAVAASDQDNSLATFSNYGKENVDVAAPGTTILSTVAMDYYLPFLKKDKQADNAYYNPLDAEVVELEEETQPQAVEEVSTVRYAVGDLEISNIRKSITDENGNTRYEDVSDIVSFTTYAKGYDNKALSLSTRGLAYGDTIQFDIKVENPYYGKSAPTEQLYVSMVNSSVESSPENILHGIQIAQKDKKNLAIHSSGAYPDSWNAPLAEVSVDPAEEYLTFEVTVLVRADTASEILFDEFGIGTSTGKYGLMSGTSMATPMATGAVALVASVYPNETVQQIRDRIIGGVVPLSADGEKVASGGRIDLESAIANPNPVASSVIVKNGSGLLTGNFLNGSILEIDGKAVKIESRSDKDIVFNAYGIALNQYHEVTLIKNKKSYTYRLWFAEKAEDVETITSMPDNMYSVDGELFAGNNKLYYVDGIGQLYILNGNKWQLDKNFSIAVGSERAGGIQYGGYFYHDNHIWAVGYVMVSEGVTELVLNCYDLQSKSWTQGTVISDCNGLVYEENGSLVMKRTVYQDKLYIYAANYAMDGTGIVSFDLKTGDVQNEPVPENFDEMLNYGRPIAFQTVGDKLVLVHPQMTGVEYPAFNTVAEVYLFDGTKWTKGKSIDCKDENAMNQMILSSEVAYQDKLVFTDLQMEGYGDTITYQVSKDKWESADYSVGDLDVRDAATLNDYYYFITLDGTLCRISMKEQESFIPPVWGDIGNTTTDPNQGDENGTWKQNEKGWWLERKDGSYPINEWAEVDGKWYHFDNLGYMQTGWVSVPSGWYYLNADGSMATGWQLINGKWYYLNEQGTMQTGWISVSSGWYYLNADGSMATGWQFIDGKWYYLNEQGTMLTGWNDINGKWYYLGDNGAMWEDTTTPDGYQVNASGAWTE